jgi:hypothetical protein
MAVNYNFAGPKILKDSSLIMLHDPKNPNSYNETYGNTWRNLIRRFGYNFIAALGHQNIFYDLNYDNTESSFLMSGNNTMIASGTGITLSDFTFFIWCKATGPTAGGGRPIWISVGGTSFYMPISIDLTYRIVGGVFQGVNQSSISTTRPQAIGEWKCYTVVNSSGIITIYAENQIETGTTVVGGGNSAPNFIVKSGTNYVPGPDRDAVGKIGMFFLYNRVLSQAEITQNFNATRGRFGI